jgi:hypothetical protein
MVDLKPKLEDFIKNILPRHQAEIEKDEKAIHAINSSEMEKVERVEIIREWLIFYKVVMFFEPSKSTGVAEKILEFADSGRSMGQALDRDAMIVEYSRLEGRIREVSLLTRSGKPRGIQSLTSKALWCCYPHDVRIFDSYAQRALYVISKLNGYKCEDDSSYKDFIEVWDQAYAQVQSIVESPELGQYLYKVRIFDRFLWHLGQRKFNW